MKPSMRACLLLVVLALTAAGCAKLAHLQELLTLKALSEEKDAQEKFVNEEFARFERVAQAVDHGTISSFETGEKILKEFGRPMASQVITRDGQQFQQWLYRHPILAQAKTRVYLYLTPESRLVYWEHLPSKEVEIKGN